MFKKPKLPEFEDFSERTEFIIIEFNVPLVHLPDNCWYNWFGGKPREYDVTMLEPVNNWEAESFEAWQKIVEKSL